MKKIVFVWFVISHFFFIPLSWSDDLNDGIKIDDPIDDKLGFSKNINFIKQQAKAKMNSGKAIVNDGCQGTGNINVAPGANLKNATIVNLSDNKNSSTVCNNK
jgi:hypothetical protein